MNKSLVTLERLRTFARVAERGNFSAVARELETGQPTITRQIRELEDAMGVQLFSRTTRRVTLTDEGQRFYEHSLSILQLVDQACQDALTTRGALSGTIRVSCTAALGVLHITRLLFEFQDNYPDITIDLSLADERVNLVREGVDIALRLGPIGDSTMKLRKLGESHRLLVASPAYLAINGMPATPQEMGLHTGVRMTNVIGSDTLTLRGAEGQTCSVALESRFRVDHGLAAREALIAGRGLAPTHRWLVNDLLEEGRLTQILPDYLVESVPLNMLIVPERSQVPRVRLLVDFLVAQIKRIPGIT